MDRSQDTRIRAEVEQRLAAEPAIDLAAMRVDVDAAIVLLYGSVAGIEAWQCAIRNAQLVEGVRSVVDYLVIERATTVFPCRAPRSSGAVTAAPGPYPAAPENDRFSYMGGAPPVSLRRTWPTLRTHAKYQ